MVFWLYYCNTLSGYAATNRNDWEVSIGTSPDNRMVIGSATKFGSSYTAFDAAGEPIARLATRDEALHAVANNAGDQLGGTRPLPMLRLGA